MGDAENIRERHFAVDQNFEGWRLDWFLSNRIPRLSRSKAAEIVKFGDVTVLPERRAKASTRLHNGDVVILREHLPPEALQDDEVGVLFADEALVILSKPAGMLVHEAANVRQNTAGGFLERHGFLGAEPVHRIDRETSGVLVCSRYPAGVPALRERFATDHPEKTYRALVVDPEGVWQPGQTASIDTPLGLDPTSFLGVRMGVGDLSARTHVTCVRRGHVVHPRLGRVELADLEVCIETGRQHQIRVHLAMGGTPIAGDKLYTYDDTFFAAICDDPSDAELKDRLVFGRHALHAWRLGIDHPLTRLPVRFEAPLPDLWSRVTFES